MAGQAALGLVGPDIIGIAVEPKAGTVVIHVAVRHQSPEIAEDIDNIASELDTFLPGGPEQAPTITTELHIGPPDCTWPGRHHELLYLAKT